MSDRVAQSEISYDAIVIGGGFYGSAIACYLAGQRGKKTLLIEREPALLRRASFNNQARVHNGYHYPRSFTTAYRSRINLPLFVRDWGDAITRDFEKIYAIARVNSKVTARQFTKFCKEIGASLELADVHISQMFDRQLIEEVFVANEYVFNAEMIAAQARHELAQQGVDVRYNTRASHISRSNAGPLQLLLQDNEQRTTQVAAPLVFNCTYAAVNQLIGDGASTKTRLKQEITEMALIAVPACLARFGITVMDGPFFSVMPFPARKSHTLSHVRYTPHCQWLDDAGEDTTDRLANHERVSRYEWMVRDAERYLPAIRDAVYQDSLYEVKTVLVKNETDDGRPILFEKHAELPGLHSVLGGKIDNIYDVIQRLDMEAL